mmetsp:Transcript_31899/g.85316  ORF Transcript_31899/g.85316 Transcript_31899/m.85316 type:complete len:539 (-) Transcript_31899:18-1634(-)
MARKGAEETTFEAQEVGVLNWLLERPDVSEAVDLAMGGEETEAKPLLMRALRVILDKQIEAVGANPPVSPDASQRVEERPHVHPEKPAKRLKRSSSGAVAPSSTPLKARCICVAVSGLHGCGKSALCKVLCDTLGGTWLSYDEVTSKQPGKKAREVFLIELRAALARSLAHATRDQNERLIFVDRTHTLRNQRADLFQELRRARWREKGGSTFMVEFSHTADSYGYGGDGQISKRYSENHISLCVRRIELRGAAHQALHPTPKLRATLQNAAKIAEAPTPEELGQFDGRITAEVSQTPPELALCVIEEMKKLQWLSCGKTRTKSDVAWQAYQRAESQWRAGATEVEPPNEWLSQCRRALEAERAIERARVEKPVAPEQRSSTPLYYKIDLPEVSKVLTQRGILPASFTPVEHPHTTLLHLGDGDETRAAESAGLSREQFVGMRDALEAFQGEVFEVRMTEIVIEENVACAVVSLPSVVPCANKVPHVTLGIKPGISPKYANEMLAEVRAGRTEGVTSITLPTPRPLVGKLLLEYTSKP